ncbi:MAG: hypothetical protein RJQ09_18125 [Cyclobacteriaceae bacterium]
MKQFALISIIALSIVSSCSTSTEPTETILGKWQAEWETDPASFPEVTDMKSFKMNGEITFYPDSVEINAFGFEGCIFSADTLRHALKWEIENDSLLNLINEDDIQGMSYTIKEVSGESIRLQLMDDIFLTLKK